MAKRKHSKAQKSRPQHAVALGTANADAGPLRLWGYHPVRAAFANDRRRITAMTITDSAVRQFATAPKAISRRMQDTPTRVAAARELSALVPPGAVHQGIVVDAEPLPRVSLRSLLEDTGDADTGRGPPTRETPPGKTLLVLDQVTDPHNVGAILRTAAVFGVQAVISTQRHSPPETGTLAKSAAGALDILPWVRVANLAQAIEALKADGFWITGLAGESDRTIARSNIEADTKTALVLGAEGKGLRRLTKEKCDILVRIPMSYASKENCVNLIDSLNVSNAAAVALYEIQRSRIEA